MTFEAWLQFCRKATAASVSIVALTLGACSGSSRPASSAADLPSYGPNEAVLFDDTFSAAVFDTTIAPAPDWRAKMNNRTAAADAVVRARISTVSSQQSEAMSSLELEFTPAGAALAGRTETASIMVELPSRSPSFAVVGVDSSALIGKTVILFYRRYNQDGTATVHWRAEPDTQTVTAAVHQAAVLRK